MMKMMKYTDESPYQTSYAGGAIIYTTIEIEVYDKDCGSASILYIKMTETGSKRDKIISHSLPKVEVLKLRDMLNSLEF